MATLTMAERSAESSAGACCPCRTVCPRASRLIGRLEGEVMSTVALGAKENPVTAPPALRLTTAVACCHHGLPAEGNKPTSFLSGR